MILRSNDCIQMESYTKGDGSSTSVTVKASIFTLTSQCMKETGKMICVMVEAK